MEIGHVGIILYIDRIMTEYVLLTVSMTDLYIENSNTCAVEYV